MKSVQLRLSPPKLRLDLFFIPEFRSSSSSPSAGDTTPASQPIMAGTFSRRNWGKTPVRRETRQRVQSRSAFTAARKRTGGRDASSPTKVVGILYETVQNGGLQLEALLRVGVHLLRTVSSVEDVGSQDNRQVTAVHLVLGTPAIEERKQRKAV